jgi:hypothetical protein
MQEYKTFFSTQRIRSLFISIFFLACALVLQFYAGNYTALHATTPVGDIFLDNIPVINLNPIIIEGALWAILFSCVLMLFRPRYILFILKTVTVFVVVRSFFMVITHVGIYPGQTVPGPGFFDHLYVVLNLQTGYFFSAHTGLTFLMALIFWNEKFWRYIFICLSLLFGISVLLAHVHYSIDVFAAPFMTYGIFKLSEYFFKKNTNT